MISLRLPAAGGGMLAAFGALDAVTSKVGRADEVAWTDLDLSGDLPPGSTHAILQVMIMCGADNPGGNTLQRASFRKKGETAAAKTFSMHVMTPNVATAWGDTVVGLAIVPVDGNRVCQYRYDHVDVEAASHYLTVEYLGGFQISA